MKKIIALCFTAFIFHQSTKAQTIFVDPVNGHDKAAGTAVAPLQSLDSAVTKASKFTGSHSIKIKLAAGLYTIIKPTVIVPLNIKNDTVHYAIEAAVMPDDATWTPNKMPVIQCVADSNRTGKLRHASNALLIARNNVSIAGLKFVGNPNPASAYYYAIERRDTALTGLQISQCLFIADKNSAPMQGGVMAQGEGTHVSNCVFYGVKNAVMAFLGLKDFSLTNSIIYGAYEGAVWYSYGTGSNVPFTFNNNIIANSNYVFVGYKGLHPSYAFSNSLFSGNEHYLGFNNNTIEPDNENKPKEINVKKNGKVILNQINANSIPNNYLHLSPLSAGKEIPAGIFKK